MSATSTASALQRAIAYLGAVEVAPERYAYRDDAMNRYYVAKLDDMLDLGARLANSEHPICLTCGDTDCDVVGHTTRRDEEDPRYIYIFTLVRRHASR